MEKQHKECAYCSKVILYNSRNKKQRFCSVTCRVSFNNKNRIWNETSKAKISISAKNRYQGANNPNYRGGGLKFTCLNCTSIFFVAIGQFNSKKHSGKYCSHKCRFEDKAKTKVPECQIRINKKFRNGICRALKNKVLNDSILFRHVDYSLQDLKSHLESLFKKGMTWENNNNLSDGWHIDHIKPVSYFNFNSLSDEEFKKCWALKNLQPLWKFENLSKGGKNTIVNQKKYGRG